MKIEIKEKIEGGKLTKGESQEFEDRRLGGAQPGNRFVSFVRAYARSGCLVELDQNVCRLPFSLFPFWSWGVLGLFFFGLGWARGALPFPFWS